MHGVVEESKQELRPPRGIVARLRALRVPGAAWTALFLVALVAVTVFVYYRAMNRVFVADHLCYLWELGGSDSLWDGLRHYDYPITRRFCKGDESLYRPLFFVWLAVNNWLFGSDYFWWNVANLGLHVAVAILLFALLRTLQPSPVAGAFALLFAVSNSQADLVTWHHLGGYLAGYAFFLFALIAAHRVIDRQRPSKVPWLTLFALSMTVACLFYEVLVVMSAFVALYLSYREFRRTDGRRWQVIVAALVPGVIFTGLYIIHALHAPRLFYVDQDHMRHGESLATLLFDEAFHQTATRLRQVLCPWDYVYVVYPYARSVLKQVRMSDKSSFMVWAGAAAYLSLCFGLWRTITRSHLRQRLPLVLTLAAMVVAYSFLIGFGRQGVHADNPYYLYFFALILTILVYAIPDWSRERVRWTPVLVGLGVLVVINAHFTYNSSVEVEKANRAADRYFTSIRQFVAKHRHEPGFSFAVRDLTNQTDVNASLFAGYPDTPKFWIHPPVSAILFVRYYNRQSPRYLLDWNGESLFVARERI